MKAIIHTKPLYLFLLSLFFIFHGYTENFDLIPVTDVLPLLLVYLLATTILTCICWLIYRNISKAALLAFLLMGFYFFFGAVYDRILDTAPHSFFAKYSVILGGYFLLLVAIIIFLFRYKRPLGTFNYVMNVFLLLLLLVDAAWLVSKIFNRKEFSDTTFKNQFTVCDTCEKPDIYLIVADDYAGDTPLLRLMNFDNHEFKDQLNTRGFYTPASRSNYNYTPFSIASMLSMNYLQNIEGSNTSHSDLSLCYKTIRENQAFQFLFYHGYQLYNYSIFDIYDQPSLVKESILPEKTRFITAQTLFRRLESNMLFNMADNLGEEAKKRRLMLTYNSNVRALDSARSITAHEASMPRFIYTHLIMPHYPYYFDKAGVFRKYEDMRSIQEKNLPHYLEYLQYTNKILLDLIDTILVKSRKPPVIILLSDHGFREYPTKVDKKYIFMNQLCIYTPRKNYSGFYEGMSNVNVFRTLFNQQFNQKFPILKDSSSFLRP